MTILGMVNLKFRIAKFSFTELFFFLKRAAIQKLYVVDGTVVWEDSCAHPLEGSVVDSYLADFELMRDCSGRLERPQQRWRFDYDFLDSIFS